MLEVSNISVTYGQHHALSDAALRTSSAARSLSFSAPMARASHRCSKPSPACCRHQPRSSNSPVVICPVCRLMRSWKPGLRWCREGRGVFGELTVAENLLLGANLKRARAVEAAQRAKVMTLFPRLGERLAQTVRTMSGGEQQMVAIGRALMSDPDILLLDEPSLGLSPLLVRELFAALRKVRETGVGLLLVEQNAPRESGYRRSRLSDRERQDHRQRLRRSPAIRRRRAPRLSRRARQRRGPKFKRSIQRRTSS